MLNQTPSIVYELNISSTDFSNKLINILTSNTYKTISITNKKFQTPLIEIIQKIQDINPQLKIIPYYSLKYNQQKSLLETTQHLLQKLEELHNLNIPEILLISGVPQPKYDTIQILENFKITNNFEKIPKIAVAHNPFLLGKDLEIENKRIITKIKTNIITSIYFQIGINQKTIIDAIKFLRSLQPNLNIYLSIINPTPSRLAQLRYRPWKGVFLPEEYLISSEIAMKANLSIINLAKEFKVGIIQGD